MYPERIAELFGYFTSNFWVLLKAALLHTIPLSILSFIFGLIIGFIVALMRLSHCKPLVGVAKFYSWIIRGTPLLVQLFIIFYGLPSFGIILSPFASAVVGLSIAQGAYNSETIRAAILAIPKGQWEAAKALGMTKWQMYIHIIIPQAATIAIPTLSNSFIGLTKDTSMTGVLTVPELFHRGQQIVALIYEPMLIYLEVALIYLVLNSFLTFLQGKLEKKFSNTKKLEHPKRRRFLKAV